MASSFLRNAAAAKTILASSSRRRPPSDEIILFPKMVWISAKAGWPGSQVAFAAG